jgi:RNA polymerase sigma-70 factor (ECF subfamily)
MEKPQSGRAIARALSGDSAAREECLRGIWRDFYPRLVVFVRTFDRRMREEAEDLVQEIMEKVFRGMDSYDPSFGFSTWVFSIARNHCVDRLRRLRIEPGTTSLWDLPDSSQPTGSSTPESALLVEDGEARIASFMEAAGAATRQLAFLRFHQCLSYREIGRIMGAPVGTIKFRVHELRRRLREHLAGAGPLAGSSRGKPAPLAAITGQPWPREDGHA